MSGVVPPKESARDCVPCDVTALCCVAASASGWASMNKTGEEKEAVLNVFAELMQPLTRIAFEYGITAGATQFARVRPWAPLSKTSTRSRSC